MKKNRVIVFVIAMLIVVTVGLASLAGCRRNKGKVIVATVFPVAQLTKKIVGDKYEVHQLIKGEVHGHEYTTEDQKEIEKAAKVFYISDELEGEEVKKWKNGVPVIDEKELIKGEEHHHHGDKHGHNHDHEEHHHHDHEEAHDHHHKKEHGHHVGAHQEQSGHDHAGHHHHHEKDPHVWTSPKRALKMLENIKNEIVKLDSKNKKYYEDNYNKAKTELEKIDKGYEKAVKEMSDKAFHVTHGAFGYLANDYGLKQEALTQHEIESSANDKAKFIDDLVEDKAKILYYVDDESSEDYKSAKSIQDEVKKKGHEMKIARLNRIIFSNNEKDDYFKVLADNLTVLKENK